MRPIKLILNDFALYADSIVGRWNKAETPTVMQTAMFEKPQRNLQIEDVSGRPRYSVNGKSYHSAVAHKTDWGLQIVTVTVLAHNQYTIGQTFRQFEQEMPGTFTTKQAAAKLAEWQDSMAQDPKAAIARSAEKTPMHFSRVQAVRNPAPFTHRPTRSAWFNPPL